MCIQEEILAELEQLEREEIEDDVTADTLPSVPSEEPEQTHSSKGDSILTKSFVSVHGVKKHVWKARVLYKGVILQVFNVFMWLI